MAWDPIVMMNLVFCVVILLLGLYIYLMRKNSLALIIAVAFGLFGVSHAFTLGGMAIDFALPLVVIRSAAYALVIIILIYEAYVGGKAKPAPARKRR